jgi:GTPase
MSEQTFRSGFVSLIGRPNVGKSTLLNQLAGIRLAITSPKAQTTRQVVRAVLDDDNSQVIFLDTPGFHKPRTKLGEYMMASAATALSDGDIILLLIDAEAAAGSKTANSVPSIERDILQRATWQEKPVILVLNKVDKMTKEDLLPLIAAYSAAFNFAALIPVSAKTGDGVEALVKVIRSLLPEGPRYYPVDSVTDQTERMLCAELIREQILFLTSEEIPHGTAVDIESFDEYVGDDPITDETADDRDFVRISAVIYCDKDTHKGILIGHQGSVLKKIGTNARVQIEQLLGCKSYLELHIIVREDWRNRRGILRNLGYEIKG